MQRDNKKIRRCHWPAASVWHAKMTRYEWAFIKILGHTHTNNEISPNTKHLVEQTRELAIILIFWKGRFTFILYWKILFLPPKKVHYIEVMSSNFHLLCFIPTGPLKRSYTPSCSPCSLKVCRTWVGKQKEQHTWTTSLSEGCFQD